MREIGRRGVERFELELPARMAVLSETGDRPSLCPVTLKTKNISSSGAFFATDQLLGSGTLLDIDLTLPFSRKENGIEKKSTVRVKGEVVRVVPGGLAVRFARQYRITPG